MRTLLIDNYDSFTFNLFQLLAEVNGVPPTVVRNDAAPWSELRGLAYDAIVLSPGPGRPEHAVDFGVCRDAVLEAAVPILGVCLGHQGLCHLLGGTVVQSTPVVHGRPSGVLHDGRGLFAGLPSPFRAIRYHSLEVGALPPELRATARTPDGVLMAVEHAERPLFGVQFHPESIGTEHGAALLANFRRLAEEHWTHHPRPAGAGDGTVPAGRHALVLAAAPGRSEAEPAMRALRAYAERVDTPPAAEDAFAALFAGSPVAFWLDSALPGAGARWSWMGDGGGPHAEHVAYDQAANRVTRTPTGVPGAAEERRESVFELLDRVLRPHAEQEPRPFGPFDGGYVGYLGYELQADSAAERAHAAPGPDAELLFADRFLAFDHAEGTAWMVALEEPEREPRARAWLRETRARLEAVRPAPPPAPPAAPGTEAELAPRFRHDAAAYLELIEACRREIHAGEAYELCLTNRIELPVQLDAFATYRALRRSNPAPFAAFLRFPGALVASSSPERFLRVGADGIVEACPIKGTRPRGRTPEEDRRLVAELVGSEKERAENLMIVDLLRNDVGRVSEIGSVHVPHLFAVESYATVHQLVSTIRGRLRPGVSAVQAVRAAFPGGSMTGAPKRRACELLDRIEAGPRGVYSGALGYFARSGAADLSIVIRTIVIDAGAVSVGVGGAITALSDPQAELEEALLKARAPLAAIAATARPADSARGPAGGRT